MRRSRTPMSRRLCWRMAAQPAADHPTSRRTPQPPKTTASSPMQLYLLRWETWWSDDSRPTLVISATDLSHLADHRCVQLHGALKSELKRSAFHWRSKMASVTKPHKLVLYRGSHSAHFDLKWAVPVQRSLTTHVIPECGFNGTCQFFSLTKTCCFCE